MVEALRCSHCSAPVVDDRWINCPYCGSVLAKPTVNPLRAVVAPERFDAVERSPVYTDAAKDEPSAAGAIMGHGFRTVFLVVWTAMAIFMTAASLPMGPVSLIPLTMGIVGVILVFVSANEARRLATARTERVVAVWRDERTEVSGGGERSSASTNHFVLLERRDGRRSEYACSAKLAGMTAPGDIGVAFLRAGTLLDFRRVDA